jgi:hypothetical protein
LVLSIGIAENVSERELRGFATRFRDDGGSAVDVSRQRCGDIEGIAAPFVGLEFNTIGSHQRLEERADAVLAVDNQHLRNSRTSRCASQWTDWERIGIANLREQHDCSDRVPKGNACEQRAHPLVA